MKYATSEEIIKTSISIGFKVHLVLSSRKNNTCTINNSKGAVSKYNSVFP